MINKLPCFLRTDANLQQAQTLRDQVAARPDIADAQVIDKKQALQDFKQRTNLGTITDSLPSNPIPHLIIINPKDSVADLVALKKLQTDLRNLKQVEYVQFDLIWIQRIQATLEVLFRILWIITIVLLATVGLIITNVIRWEVASRHEELEIIRLVGGTDAYVRRPFLYSGFWLGFIGAAFAVLIVKISGWFVNLAIDQLAKLYDSDIQLLSLPVSLMALMLFLGGVFGAAGAWVAVNQKLRALA